MLTISPHYTRDHVKLESASVDDRIAVLEDRFRGYFTTPCRLLENIYDDSALLILLAVLTCVEPIECLSRGESSKNRSEDFFKSGVRRVFGLTPPREADSANYERETDTVLKALYVQVRCGLMHSAATRSRVVIERDLPVAARVAVNTRTGKADRIEIQVNKLLMQFELFLSEYFTQLRNPENVELRKKFDQGWLAMREDAE